MDYDDDAAELAALVAADEAALIALDDRRRIVCCNDAAARILGGEPALLAGHDLLERIAVSRHAAAIAAFGPRSGVPTPVTIVREDDEVDVEISTWYREADGRRQRLVRLSEVRPEAPEQDTATAEPVAVEPEPVAVRPEPAVAEAEPAPEPAPEPEPVAVEPEPARPALDTELVPALTRLVAHTEAPGIAVTPPAPVELPELPGPVVVALYRIAQEALQNAVDHSGAGAVSVGLRVDTGAAELEIADDGRGFDPASAPEGFGLRTMRSRADRAGARLRVDSRPGAGTRVTAWLPLSSGIPAPRSSGRADADSGAVAGSPA